MTMKKVIPLLFAVLSAALFLSGCAGSNRQLDPAGVYAGDKILYTADATITGAYETLDTFVAWEHKHRAGLSKWPEVRSAADYVRTNAKTWIDNAITVRELYKNFPTPENRKSLEGALVILRAALDQASAYYQSRAPQTST